MMRQITPLVAVGALVLIAVVLGRSGPRSLAQQEEIPPPAAMLPAPSSAAFQYQGVASCASVACHHGNGPSGTKGSEYTTWIAQKDPHSRAYTVLFDPRSLLIEKNLKGLKDLKQAQPHKDMLCLRCHVNPDVESAEHHERFSRADGVGCESCHGAAERWLSVHYTAPWRSLPPDEKKKAGMVNTKDIGERARMCVRCHVGWQDADVNHDLIAAGHPRLRFEYGAYLANYPARHWKLADDHGRYAVDGDPTKSDFEARAWLVGQAAAAKAAIELLAYRANPKHDRPWPEFAEYGCFSCHHQLQDEAWKRKLQDQAWRKRGNAGQMEWGTWYFSQRDIVAGMVRAAQPADNELFDELGRMMGKSDPQQRKKLISEATKAANVLERWMSEMAKRDIWDEKSLEKLLAVLTKEQTQSEQADWDRAAQRYLGIAAIYNALGDMDEKYRQDVRLKSSLHRLADILSSAMPKTPQARYDSPGCFKLEAWQKNLKELREQLQRRGVE